MEEEDGEDFTSMAMDSSSPTDLPFIKANLTLSKFFNVSVPIEDKFNFRWHLDKNNLTEQVNQLDLLPPIHPSTNFALFLCSLVFAMFWITYITFFNSRVVGALATNLANRFLHLFVKGGYVKVGSLSFSVMAGKVMFRDFALLTPDYSVRAQDGYLIFRWWRSYVPKDVSEDLSNSDTRLSVQLNGFELHTYNRSHVYRDLEKKFGLEPGLLPGEDDEEEVEEKEDEGGGASLGTDWRDLIPVIKVDISTCKFVFGNRLLPTTLLVTVEEAHFTYSTKPASTSLDHFMHFVKTKAENLKVVLAESPKYTGLRAHDEAPRYMGEGFVVLASNQVRLYYYQDEAGLVPEHTQLLTTASGDLVEPASPCWGLDITCEKATDFSYGPWADRQREMLYKFFFPPDYQPLESTPPAQPGQRRVAKRFDIKFNTLADSTIDILFSKQKETRAVHMNIAPGSFFEMELPWVVEDDNGYTSRLKGTLMTPEATTSLGYRDFLQCETFEFAIDMTYPKYWNGHQEWVYTFTVSRASLDFIFAHKWFFCDLVDDWSSRSPPDLLSFVPYTWRFQFILKEFELRTPANEFNWIDTASSNPENSFLAICGQNLSIEFTLPFTDFLPDTVPFVFKVLGEHLDLSAFLPDTNTSHDILFTLDQSARLVGREGQLVWKRELQEGKWRRKCQYSSGWIDCWSVPSLVLAIEFLYHPAPMDGPPPQADITTPDKESSLLGPLRPDAAQSQPASPGQASASSSRKEFSFDPTTLEPDICKVDLEVGPSVAFLYGTLIRNFMHVKENLFGEDQQYTAMDEAENSKREKDDGKEAGPVDFRDYRPLNVILDITVHDLQANLVRYCSEKDPPCPYLTVEKLVFEMDKKYRETRLQLLLSPVLLTASDLVSRETREEHLQQSNLLLTGLQFRGHAMFSELDRPLGADTLEYAWLMELQCGNLMGKVTVPQLHHIVISLETLLNLTVDKENVMKHPRPYKICQHDVKQLDCGESVEDTPCPTVEDVKYTMLRFSLDLVDIHLVETNTALRLQACPVRLATCNLHGTHTSQGVTAIINSVQLHQYISSNTKTNRMDSTAVHHPDIWLETGAVKVGPIYLEGAFASHGIKNSNFQNNQNSFLQKHDRRTRKLWFLWPPVTNVAAALQGKCGCVGGCNFFGSNESGPTFFKPSRLELESRVNVALLSLKRRVEGPGYGQSILHEETLALDRCISYVGDRSVLTDGCLPDCWPQTAEQPSLLPPCPGWRQPSTRQSNTSSSGTAEPSTTPRLRRQKTKGKRSGPSTPHLAGDETLRRKRNSETGSMRRHSGQQRPATLEKARPRETVEMPPKMQKAASLVEVKQEVGSTLVRTESLVSEALSFYSLDGAVTGSRTTLSSCPQSPGTSTAMDTAMDTSIDTPTLAYATPEPEELSSSVPGSRSKERSDTVSLSRSVSEASDFEDALSEQEEQAMVNLHMQVNKPITESPLLLSSYLPHLTQLRCRCWESRHGSLTRRQTNLLQQFPHFEMLQEGFSCIQMSDRDQAGQKKRPEQFPTPSHPQSFSWTWEDMSGTEEDTSSSSAGRQTLLHSLSDSNTSKATIVVRFQDSVDIVASPIMLESLQRYIEALAPTMELLHPLSVINHLHWASLDRVEEKNSLKKEKSLDLQDGKVVASDSKPGLPYQSISRTFEKSVSSSVQGSLHLPKVNVMVLQASVVEEMCAFSALDNVKDITCVSLLALGIGDTSFRFQKTSQSKKIVQVLSQDSRLPGSKKKRKSKYKKIAQLPLGTLAFESSETQLEEIMMNGSISKVHAQLRRLRNDSSLLKDAAITAIPSHRSQVFFDYLNVPKLSQSTSLPDLEEVDVREPDVHPLGFNMCEAGLEGIQVKISKKSCNKDTDKDVEEVVKVHTEDETTPESPGSKDTVVLLGELGAEVELDEGEEEAIEVEIEETPESERKEEVPVSPTDMENEKEEIKEDEEVKMKPTVQGKSSKAAASMNFQTVWFNFAAPPKTPISKKIDFTKLDWNLLSTGSPGIDAWLQPFDRTQQALTDLLARYNCRVGAIMASVMADALDVRQLHFPKVSKYENLTALAKTLKEDPSCQLCSVLLRYISRAGVGEVEANLDRKVVPPLTTLRQGIVVLSRQWKNVLYTPILIEYNLKTRGMKNLFQHDMRIEEEGETEETSEEEEGFSDTDMDDEALLLKSKGGVDTYKQEGSIISNLSYFRNRGFRSPGHQRSPNSEDILALLESGQDRGRTSIREGGSIYSDDSAAVRSKGSERVLSGAASPVPRAKLGKVGPGGSGEEEDLYNWMRRQQISGKEELAKEKGNSLDSDKKSPGEMGPERSVTIQVEDMDEKQEGKERVIPPTTEPGSTSGNSFVDAHIIFEPILSSLGLMPQQITNLSLKNLGSHVIIEGGVESFKIDIVESEIGKDKEPRKTKVKFPKMTIEPDSTTPAFICQKIGLHVDFKKITDILKGEKLSKNRVLPLYVSRNQLKRHTSSFATFSIEIDSISQTVNMPLLRLLNQIVTMHLNVKEMSEELKEKKPGGSGYKKEGDYAKEREGYKRHKKHSSGSSASEVGSVTLRPDELSLVGSSLNLSHSQPSRAGHHSSPSPTIAIRSAPKPRPKGFASRLRPNSRLGYSSLGDSPATEQTDSFLLTGQPLEKITEEQATKCWRTIYYLLDLYATQPETKVVAQRNSLTNLSQPDVSLLQRSKMKYAAMRNDHVKTPDTVKSEEVKEVLEKEEESREVKASSPSKTVSFAKKTGPGEEGLKEHMPLIVIGEAKINQVNLAATLSGLRLEGQIRGLGSSISYKERLRTVQRGVSVEAVISGNVRETSIALLEGVAPAQQTVVRLTVGPTDTNYTSHMWKSKDRNTGHLSIGPVHVDIPQHPVTLHGIMTRSTKQITSTLMEFKGTRILYRGKTSAMDDSDLEPRPPTVGTVEGEESHLIKPLVMTFQLVIESFAVSAALLPSLQAQYKMEMVTSKGVTGSKAKFSATLPKHTLSFTTKLESSELREDSTLPSAAAIDLPQVTFLAEYIQDQSHPTLEPKKAADGSMYSKGNYFRAKAEIGELDHCLTTDMLNHLVFVQKVFMKEVNEVVQKMSGGDRLVPVWTDFGEELELHHSSPSKQLLYTVSVELKRITITATTPSNSAVRFETGVSELILSNRVANVQGARYGSNKLATKAKIDLKLSLGQLIRDVIYPEAEPQFQSHAYFKTSVQLRNALEDEASNTEEESNIPDKEVILITLNRPLIFLQPVAIDRAILVWLSYKNAWEYWAEQRSSLNKEVLIATQQVIERVPISQLREQISSQHTGTLFLQLNVQDIGVAIPITTDSLGNPRDTEGKGAIVCTVETTSISACSAASMASKGKFEDLCVRFCEDFNHTLDDWKPDRTDDSLLNLCTVSEGSYEVCSKTSKAVRDDVSGSMENAKWILNIQWQMTGVEVQVDTDIGKHLTALGHTLTSLTGEEEEEEEADDSSISDEMDSDVVIIEDTPTLRKQRTKLMDRDMIENLPEFVFDPTIDAAQRTKMMEREMIEQSKTIEDLRKLGATDATVNQELKKLADMEAFASKDFRKEIIHRIRRQSARTQSIKEKFGLGSGGGPLVPPQRGISIKAKAPFVPSPSEDMVDFEASVRSRLENEARKEEEGVPRYTRERKKAYSGRAASYDTIDEDSLPGSPRGERNKNKDVKGTVSPRQQPITGNVVTEKKSSEPNVDFEFDFKIYMNSGKVVLHTKPDKEEIRPLKKDRSMTGSMFDTSGSPLASRKSRHPSDKESSKLSSSRLKPNVTLTLPETSTVFFIPGLDVKVHYVSKTESDYEISYLSDTNLEHSQRESSFLKKSNNKKATLTTWMNFHSIPDETYISPSILEFLEQALEPIPIVSKPQSSQDQIDSYDPDIDPDGSTVTASLVSPSYSSFPVDVIVYFHMKQNRFRFSCLPVSRVECLLTLPSLDLVFSSKRADVEDATLEEERKREEPGRKDLGEFEGSGGLSVTGCLSDFSMHVFHPYGGGGRGRRREEERAANFSPPREPEDRKDSLSVNVAFVNFHLSRTRKVTVVHVTAPPGKLPKQSSDTQGKANIRFSTIVDIGKAAFSYDMRRLTEILAFPKAWYRRTLVRRLFLGELKTHSDIHQPGGDLESPADLHTDGFPMPKDSPLTQHSGFAGRKGSVVSTPTTKRSVAGILNDTRRRSKSTSPGLTTAQSWETLVLFGIKFKELEVGMNMGNVMGNVLWVSKDFTSEGRLSIGSTGHKNMFIGLGLKGSSLEAKGGIIGGCIDIGRIDTYCRVLEDNGTEPQHKLGARLDAMEVRFDYMGTSVLMGRVSHLEVKLNNEWQVDEAEGGRMSAEAGTTRMASVFVFGDLKWDQVQLMISKSTTSDLIKIYAKLEEFFLQQFKSSKRVLSILEPWSAGAAARGLGPGARQAKRSASIRTSNSGTGTVSHHRHWQAVLERISGLKVKTLALRLPTIGAILGGTLELSGRHISLACFHGINFKAKSWALFSMKDPFISFQSEAQGISMDGTRATNIVQNLVFSLGMGEAQLAPQHVSMAHVCKISRNYMYSPQFKTLSEWFCYAFKSSELDHVERFPVLGGGTAPHRPQDKGVFNQTLEKIFELPCLRMDLKTDHIQGERPPTQDDKERPKVVCSCVTDFEDHIFVTMDAEAFFFLHDLISSYMKEKEKVHGLTSQQSGHSPHMGDLLSPESPPGEKLSADNSPSPTTPTSTSTSAISESDWRLFECATWHLEPTVRLKNAWAGKSVDPIGVDYILQKLGFSHAKTTIPKWMQRGFMDPLDKILSVIVLNAIVVVAEDTEAADMKRRKQSNLVSKSDSFGDKKFSSSGGR